MLEIKDLKVAVDENRVILEELNLTVRAGEIHAIMGPNGSGKSTLANFIVGKNGYQKLAGSISYHGEDLESLAPDVRAQRGIFLSFQNPIEVPGVNNLLFLKTAVNAVRKARGEEPLDSADFMQLARECAAKVGLNEDFLKRPLNSGFSGGEKKRNEILQLLMLDPSLVILDEPDSGLDVDALTKVADGINQFYTPQKAMIIITHYPRILELVRPHFVHLFGQGKILRSGGYELAREIEKAGYAALEKSIYHKNKNPV